jgi:transposase
MGADRAADHRAAGPERFDEPQQSDVRRGRAVDRTHGAPWRDLPDVFGEWNSVFRRFSRWSAKGIWWRIFAALSDDPDFEYLIIDSTIVRAHQHAAGAKKGGLKILPSAAPAAA